MNRNSNTAAWTPVRTRDLVQAALLTALVFISTRFINLRLPVSVNGGLIHLGNAMLFIAAIVFGRNKGAIAGAFGMGLFDIVSGWAAWAPFTFIIRGAMGYIIGTAAYMGDKKGCNIAYNAAGIVAAGICMVAGYYATEVILYGNLLAPMTSIPGNLIQLAVGAAIALPASAGLKRTKIF